MHANGSLLHSRAVSGPRKHPSNQAHNETALHVVARTGPSLLAEKEGFEPSIRYNRIPDFESGAFDHSATSPEFFRASLTRVEEPRRLGGSSQALDSISSSEQFLPAKVRPPHLGDGDAAVGVLVVL